MTLHWRRTIKGIKTNHPREWGNLAWRLLFSFKARAPQYVPIRKFAAAWIDNQWEDC